VDMRSKRPVWQLEEPPDGFDEDVEADEDVIQHVPQKPGGSVGQMHSCVAPAHPATPALQQDCGAFSKTCCTQMHALDEALTCHHAVRGRICHPPSDAWSP
jgi:hypothetical protein